MARDISQHMEKIAGLMGVDFTLRGQPISLIEVFSVTGLLPGIARRADQLAALCFGYGIGVTFEDAPGTTLGRKVNFDGVTPETLRFLCMMDVIYDLQRVSPNRNVISLDPLLYD